MKLDFNKSNGLIPAIVQDAHTGRVLMLGYMNEEALQLTESSGKVTFFSRSRQSLWTKGETSGHYLELDSIIADCDHDTLLVKARPTGSVCHTGSTTCFGEQEQGFLYELQQIIAQRHLEMPDCSYTTQLFKQGVNRIAQKVGEEAVEVVIEAKDFNDEKLLRESADLLYHLMVLLQHRGLSISDVEQQLLNRHRP